jgi:hypothetical protein
MKRTEEQLDTRRCLYTKHRRNGDGLIFKNDSLHGEVEPLALHWSIKPLPRKQRRSRVRQLAADCSGNNERLVHDIHSHGKFLIHRQP